MVDTGYMLSGTPRRRLHGRRGLKCSVVTVYTAVTPSPPSRAAWIEIYRAGIRYWQLASPPSRAAWIEIAFRSREPNPSVVAAFTGGVD